MKAKTKILQKFKRNRGLLCSNEITNASERYQINKMLIAGDIERIKKGIYILRNHQNFDERILLSKVYPQAVFCLFSAWEYHELTTSIPSSHYLALSRNTKVTEVYHPQAKLFYWTNISFILGITEVNIASDKIKIYNIEKSVCDAVKFRNKVGEEITLEVIQNYMKRSDRNLEKLMQYAKQMKIEKTITPLLKTLI